MQTGLEKLINDFFDYLEVEKNSSKLTIRDYRHYLQTFAKWYSSTLPGKSIADLDLGTVRKYRVFLANRTDQKGRTLKKVTDRKSTRLNSSHQIISYAVFCLKKK